MRQYSFGVLILICGYTVSQTLSEIQNNSGSLSFLDDDNSDDFLFESIDHDREDEHGIRGDVLHHKNTGKESDFDIPEDYESEDDVVYWKSIYGEDDVPDFEIPPEIEGETIFVDLADLADEKAGEEVQVKRDIGKIKSHIMHNSPLVSRHGESSRMSYSNPRRSNYRSIMTSVYRQPQNCYGQNFGRNFKTPSAFGGDEEGQFHRSDDDYSRTAHSPNNHRIETEDIEGSELRDAAGIKASHDINFEIEDESAKQFHPALELRSLKLSGTDDSSINLKEKIIRANEDRVDTAAAEGSQSKLVAAIHDKIKAKKELVEDLISLKTSAMQGKKEFVDSFAAGVDHNERYSSNTGIEGGEKTQIETRTHQSSSKSSVHRSVLDSKREKVISTDKSLIEEVVTDGNSETNAIVRTLDAGREKIQSEMKIHDERELGYDDTDFHEDGSFRTDDQNRGSTAYDDREEIVLISKNPQHQDPLQSILDSKRKVIEAKKDLIHTAATGGSKAELTCAVVKTLDAKKDLIDSVISSKMVITDNNKKQCGRSSTCYARGSSAVAESEVQSSLVNHHRGDGGFRSCPRCQKCSKISTNFESGLKNIHTRHESVVNSKVTNIKSSKSSHHSSFIGSSNLAVTGEMRTTDGIRDVDHGRDISSSLKKKVEIDGGVSGNLNSSTINHESEVDSSYSVKTDSSRIKFANEHRMKTIHHEETSLDSTVSKTISKDLIEENDELNNDNGDEEQEISSNVSERIQTGDRISADKESVGFSEGQKEGKLSVNSVRIDSTITKSKKEEFVTGVKTIHDSESSSIKSQSGFESSISADRINLDDVEKEGIACVCSRKNETPNVLSEQETRVANFSSESNQDENKDAKLEDDDDSESQGAKCAPGKCGITGKLHVALDKTDKNENLEHKLASKTFTESKLLDNYDAEEEDGRIVEDSQTVAIGAEQVKFDHEKKVAQSDLNEDEEEKVIEDINEHNRETTKIEEQSSVIHGKQAKTITTAKTIDTSDDTVSKSIVIETQNAKTVHTKISEKNEEIRRDGLEKVNSHDREWQGTKKDSYFKNFGQFSHTHIDENSEYCGTGGILSKNADRRLINLDVNCSGITAFMNPECQQLNTQLCYPQDSSMSITLRTIKSHLNHGQELATEMQNRAKWLCDKGYVPKLHTPAMLHLINNLATEDTVEINHASEFCLFGAKSLQINFFSDYVTPNTFLEFLKHHSFRVVGTGLCHVRPKRCHGDQIYRTFDGSCNNKENPTWGRVNTAFSRISPARYSDGIHEPPKSVTGKELPNPRAISVHCFSHGSIDDNKLTLAVSQWGQILSHDFAMQLPDQTANGGIICCANAKRQLPKRLQHHSCLPIDIPADDKFYSKFGARCMEFVRSMTASREDCTLGPAEQLNTVTSYLDASPLYGSDRKTCDQLRAFQGGRMLVSIRRGRELMPTITNRSRYCDVMCPKEVCYHAGDLRANQTPHLAILQTVLLREHNRVAHVLAELNPDWDDEKLFQETRRIVLAEYQFITYHEWLPVIIGKRYCKRYKLTPQWHEDKMSRDYNPRIKANTINEFTTAAYRFFHSIVQGNINLCPIDRDITHTLRLSNHYFRPQIIERSDNFDDLIRGLVTQPMQKSDDNFHPEITEYLFRSKDPFGFDLLTLDVQRNRDHGLACYNDVRVICGLKRAEDFDDLREEIPLASIEKLRTIYENVNDIDLVVGIGLEKKCPGSILGPVARCLIGEQFYVSRVSDRYFYNNPEQPYPFTKEQLNEISKASFAKLLCNTADNLEYIQPQAFKVISRSNPLTSCSDLPDIDLSPWQESKYDK